MLTHKGLKSYWVISPVACMFMSMQTPIHMTKKVLHLNVHPAVIHGYILNLSCLPCSRSGVETVSINVAWLASVEARWSRTQLCHKARIMPCWGTWLLHSASTIVGPWERQRRWLCTKEDQKILGQLFWSNPVSALNMERHCLEHAATRSACALTLASSELGDQQ